MKFTELNALLERRPVKQWSKHLKKLEKEEQIRTKKGELWEKFRAEIITKKSINQHTPEKQGGGSHSMGHQLTLLLQTVRHQGIGTETNRTGE